MRAIAGVACLLAIAGGLGAAAAQARAAAGNGQLVAVMRAMYSGATEPDALVTLNPDGTGIRTLATFQWGTLATPAWSPDGNRIALTVFKAEHNRRVYVYELATGELRRVTDAPLKDEFNFSDINDETPSWSPDGARLAFLRGNLGLSIRSVRLDGSDERTVTAQDHDGRPLGPAWSPIADRIAYFADGLSSTTTEAALRTISPAGTGVATIFQDATAYKSDPQWSPDGTRIVYSSRFDVGSSHLRVVNATTGVRSDLTPPVPSSFDDDPDFSPDGSAVVYASNSSLGVVVADGSSSRLIPSDGRDLSQVLIEPDWQPCVTGVTVSCTSVTPIRAPTCLPSATASTSQDKPFDLPPAPCFDPQGLPLVITIVQPPGHGTLAAPGSDGRRRYTPQRGFVGQDVFRYQASNGSVASNVGTVTVNVLAVGGAARDTDAPTVQWLSRLRADRLGRVRVRVRCNERCVLSLRLSTKLRSGKTVVGPTRTVTAAAARTTTITLAIRRRGPKLSRSQVRSVTVTGSVKDAAANRRNLRRSVRRR